ncbi:unnamed protein product [Protopolystoma xenopodis]|uniref:Uncharacterized protein n=1 Tax=Protopolystoma xenopodis TaxID=117903 RepID=A0A3S5B6R9_9PLAT|nr:unnamed protein product [Protopolystoma xenopodis]
MPGWTGGAGESRGGRQGRPCRGLGEARVAARAASAPPRRRSRMGRQEMTTTTTTRGNGNKGGRRRAADARQLQPQVGATMVLLLPSWSHPRPAVQAK